MNRYRVLVCVLGLLLWTSALSHAACFGVSGSRGLEATTYEKVTVAATAIGLTAANVGVMVLVSVEAAPISIRLDGDAPTAAEGHTFAAGDSFEICGATNILAFRAIRTTGVSGILKVTHYKER